MEYPPSNGVVIDNEDLKKALVDKIYDEQSKATRTNFRAALAGEIMASLSGTAYGFNDGSVNWDVMPHPKTHRTFKHIWFSRHTSPTLKTKRA